MNKKIMIIPKPKQIEINDENFTLNEKTVIIVSNDTKKIGEFLADELRQSTGLPLPIENNASNSNYISLTMEQNKSLGDEGYELISTTEGIKITAEKPAGLFYGCQSLRQLLPPENYNKKFVANVKWEITGVSITDKPRFAWRGLMLDSGRYFWDVDFVKKFIDMMALHKMNKFHWHLTEDQGWRIEIKKYPKLTEIGAWRKKDNGETYGGSYSQKQIREIVEYASERFITVIPEIEMPGHSVAAIAAYPELSCSGTQVDVPTTWGIKENVYCAGNEKTFKFLENVILEVMDLFPSKYFHIGGDECPKENWKKCPKCQQRIKNENLKNEDELQSYFIKRMEKFINENGKQIIGWDEILEGGLAPNATVMSWRGIEGGIAAAKQGHNVIMSPITHCYFDYSQTENDIVPIGGGAIITTEKVYEFEPIPNELSTEEEKYVLGAQGNVWTEYISTVERAEEMTFPRACALAEKLWSPKNCADFADFKKRLDENLKRLEILDVDYFKI